MLYAIAMGQIIRELKVATDHAVSGVIFSEIQVTRSQKKCLRRFVRQCVRYIGKGPRRLLPDITQTPTLTLLTLPLSLSVGGDG